MTIRQIFCKSLWFQLLLLSVLGMFVYNASLYAENEEDWMPDPALRKAVREKLQLPDTTPLSLPDMLKIRDLVVLESDIANLQGLEHAVNLRFLHISRSEIVDISPLANLVDLRTLALYHNKIVDISPLANLINLEELILHHNEIVDFSPLLKLNNLQVILVHNNPGDFSQIAKLINNPDFTCVFEGNSFLERIKNRNYPSIFTGWGWDLLNFPDLSPEEQITHHDLFFTDLMFAMHWQYSVSDNESKLVGSLEAAKRERELLLEHNPNMIFLVGIYFYGGQHNAYPEDWPYWLRDESGNLIQEEGYGEYLIDFTQQGAQDLFVQQAIAISQCGLYDGIFLDWWHEGRSILFNRAGIADVDGKYQKLEVDAKLSMLKRIREAVGEDFLILVNTVQSKAIRSAPYVNGTFMETEWEAENGAYTHHQLSEIEDTLLWSEENFRYPQINCLEGYGIPTENLDSPTNQRWMRVFTTLSLTHSDGYVLYSHDRGHVWYDFWDADLGHPLPSSEKGQTYDGIDGLFIREFTNGWAVYNRSGKEQQIEFSEAVLGVANGVKDQRSHTLPDLDGEIYLKQGTGASVDVNGDGVVNIQDLVIVANALGEAEPDLNGDGVVNIQDLVLVADAF